MRQWFGRLNLAAFRTQRARASVNRFCPLFPVLCSLFPLPCLSAPLTQGRKFVWTLQYKPGEERRIRLVTTMRGVMADGGETLVRLTQTDRIAVQTVAPDGTATFMQTPETRLTVVNGKTIPSSAKKLGATRLTVSKTGRILAQTSDSSPTPNDNLRRLNLIVNATPTPPHPVAVGETWRTPLDNPFVKNSKVIVTSTLQAQETVQGIPTLRVAIAVDVPTEANSLALPDGKPALVHSEGVYHIDPATGRILSATRKLSGVKVSTLAGGSMTMNLSSRLTLLASKPLAAQRTPVRSPR